MLAEPWAAVESTSFDLGTKGSRRPWLISLFSTEDTTGIIDPATFEVFEELFGNNIAHDLVLLSIATDAEVAMRIVEEHKVVLPGMNETEAPNFEHLRRIVYANINHRIDAYMALLTRARNEHPKFQ